MEIVERKFFFMKDDVSYAYSYGSTKFSMEIFEIEYNNLVIFFIRQKKKLTARFLTNRQNMEQLCLRSQRCMNGGARVRSHTAARMSVIFEIHRTR